MMQVGTSRSMLRLAGAGQSRMGCYGGVRRAEWFAVLAGSPSLAPHVYQRQATVNTKLYLPMSSKMAPCIFCKIIKGSFPANRV